MVMGPTLPTNFLEPPTGDVRTSPLLGRTAHGGRGTSPIARRRTRPRNSPDSSPLHSRFIAPCLACRMVEGRTDHTGLRLLVMTSVFALLAAAWLGGIMAL